MRVCVFVTTDNHTFCLIRERRCYIPLNKERETVKQGIRSSPSSFMQNGSELSSDHKPSREDEMNRIKSAGGIVINVNGISRVAQSDFEVQCFRITQR